MNFAVLIPALDCESTIAAVVAGAARHSDHVLVVDDGSTDATAARARAAGAEVLVHPRRLGKGAALVSGLRHFATRGLSHALTMDGDGQHLAEEIPLLTQAGEAAPDRLILGQRILTGVEVAPLKLFGNRFANRWVEIACGCQLPDTQSGFRLYPIDATLRLGATARHFAFETEVLIRATRAGIKITNVPIRVYYPPAQERRSHYRPFVDTLRIIRVVVGLILRRR